ncbi:MAG: F0F1 ATP synthase subunit epsilon [Pseudomonadota bacterium]
MADTFSFELVSPEKLLVSGQAEMATISGVDGDMGVMANHSAVMTSLRPGLISVKMENGNEDSYFVRGGFADVTPEGLTVLAEYAIPRAEVTAELFAEQKRIAQEDYDAQVAAGDDEKAANARSYLDQLTHLEPTILPA